MYTERKEYNNVITVKLVMPVGCNMNCSFCYNKHGAKYEPNIESFMDNFIDSLNDVIDKIGNKDNVSLDITGGEPTIDEDIFISVMDKLRRSRIHDKICRCTLTTNGTNLLALANSMKGVVDYVNISIHDFEFRSRQIAFGKNVYFSETIYTEMVSALNSVGIPASVCAVVYREIPEFDTWLDNFIFFSKLCGFSSLRLRCDVFWEKQYLFDQYMENTMNRNEVFQTITYEKTTDSHWCRLRMNDKFRVFFLHGVKDTSVTTKGIEYVVDTDGLCYCDYYRKTPLSDYKYCVGKIYDILEVRNNV